ncbi:MAG: type II toxin-antitoxin system death-on-curing family toxin, partial [Terriglobales bacterium]
FSGGYLHSDLYEMAAAYLFHIVSNHPFVDGNKRTGLAAALLFLFLNDIEVEAPQSETEALVKAVATSQADRAKVAEFLRKYATA